MLIEEWRKTKRITSGKAKVKQSHYRPREVLRVLGVLRFPDFKKIGT
jgi:hypothetical protein